MEQEKGNSRKWKRLIIVLAVFSIFLTTTSIAYAWFSIEIIGNTDTDNIDITTGGITIVYTDGPDAVLTDAYPGDFVEKTFTVENPSSVAGHYLIFWSTDIINTFVNNELVFTLSSQDGGTNVDQSVIPATSDVLAEKITIAAGATHTYTLRITFLETNADQNSNQGARFAAKVQVGESEPEGLAKIEDLTTADADYECYTFAAGTISAFTITGTCTLTNEVVIPEKINGVEVTSIAANAFNNKGLTKLTLSKNIQTIGASAFSNNSLTEVDFTHLTNLTSIGANAFFGLNNCNGALATYAKGILGTATVDPTAFSCS